MPRMLRRSVDLPLPLGPTKPTNSPFLIRKFMSLRISFPDLATDMFSMRRIMSLPSACRMVMASICEPPCWCECRAVFYNAGQMEPNSNRLGVEVVNHHSSNEEQKYTPNKENWDCINHVHKNTPLMVSLAMSRDLTSHSICKVLNVLAHHGHVIIA